jgi:uncharacterized protein YkwD
MKMLPMLLLPLLLSSCMLSFATPVPVDGAAATSYDEIETEIHRLINQERAARRLPPLVAEPEIGRIAREHSLAMANGHRPFGHGEFDDRFRSTQLLVPSAHQVSENVAFNASHPAAAADQAVRQWLGSRGHRRAILSDIQGLTGIGVARSRSGSFYFTQIFVEESGPTVAGR